MDTNTTALKTYITTQRNNGISDEVIYKTLVASGWQHDMVVQALAPETESNNEQPTVQEQVPAVIASDAAAVTQENQNVQQPLLERNDAATKSRKKVALIGKIMIGLGVITTVQVVISMFDGGMFPSMSVVVIIFALAQILIGFGILAYNKIAYTLFNILAILAILSSVFLLFSLPYNLLYMLMDPSVMTIALGILSILLSVGQLVFYIYGGIVFHKKETRALFQKKHLEA